MGLTTQYAARSETADVPAPASNEGGGRMIIVSNRAPVRVVDEAARTGIQPTAGGVGMTFLRVLERRGGLWIAWSGGHKCPPRVHLPLGDNPRFAMVFAPLSEFDVSNYYYGMCNRGLWPLMHFMISKCYFSAAHWKYYQRANRTFADLAGAEAEPGDIIWIQDFHLALAAQAIRERRQDVPIGLFWHVPFPPEEVFRIFPWQREFLHGMLGSDLIGFHTQTYVNHFLDCCERIIGLQVDRCRGEVAYGARRVAVRAFPLGIATDFFAGLAESEEVEERARKIRRALGTQIVVLGVDRLDYTKGILERLLGFERFLELNPGYRKRVTLVLIAVPSRAKMSDYVLLKRELDELVGRVVGRFSSEGWVPIRYLYRQFRQDELVAYYRAADVALLTPLRDGMNLVAKEYVASHPTDDGVLILSEFAGAAEELTEALLVNPYDIDALAARLKDAVEMSPHEKAARLSRLRAKVAANDLDHWCKTFSDALDAERSVGARPSVLSSIG
jgi:trehalose 6-phosphate synthase/phosphatase